MKQYKKSLYKYFILLAMGGCTLLTGCNDFLTTIPESSYSAAGSYQSQSDFDYAIAAVYAAQQELYKTNDWGRLYFWSRPVYRFGRYQLLVFRLAEVVDDHFP